MNANLINKLIKTKSKKSWEHTLVLSPFYKSVNTGKVDLDLVHMLDQEEKLTVNPNFKDKDNSSSFFNEIEVVFTDPPEEKKYLMKPLEPETLSPQDIAIELIKRMKNYFIQVWDNTKPTIVFTSMGMDSRIISYVLMQIRDEQGESFLGDIHFRCHGKESTYGFKELMKKQGWKSDQYSIYHEDKIGEIDEQNMGNPGNITNGYLRPTITFWEDIVPLGQEKDYNAVQGLFGGETFSYPLYPKRLFTDNRYQDLLVNIGLGRIKLANAYNRWNDFILPYIGYDFLDLSFRVPKKYFKWIDTDCYHHQQLDKGIQKLTRDQMRLEMCKVVGDEPPYFLGHVYNLVMSQTNADIMKDFYLGSKFYDQFSYIHEIRNAEPWRPYLTSGGIKQIYNNSYELKLYGLALVYERTKNH